MATFSSTASERMPPDTDACRVQFPMRFLSVREFRKGVWAHGLEYSNIGVSQCLAMPQLRLASVGAFMLYPEVSGCWWQTWRDGLVHPTVRVVLFFFTRQETDYSNNRTRCAPCGVLFKRPHHLRRPHGTACLHTEKHRVPLRFPGRYGEIRFWSMNHADLRARVRKFNLFV